MEHDDILTDDDLAEIEASQEKILDKLYAKVRNSEQAKEWLNTSLGRSFRKFLAAEKMRAMRSCAEQQADDSARAKAQLDYAVVCKLESIFGSIIVDGEEALQQLEQLNEGDTYENR